jgi:fumarate reductase subunit C
MQKAPDPWPARADMLQSLSGALLVAFVWAHMFFESSILLGKDAMLWVTRMFEGEPLFGKPYPKLVAVAVAVVFALVLLHALLALRRFPASQRQYHALHQHLGRLRHADSTLWYVQVITGFSLFFLVSAHLYPLFVQPGNIGPYASSDRVWSGNYWLLYVLLLIVVHLHAGIGFYRLTMKWGWFSGGHNPRIRQRLKTITWFVVGFYLLLGFASLATYTRIGYEHQDRAGERYRPQMEDH